MLFGSKVVMPTRLCLAWSIWLVVTTKSVVSAQASNRIRIGSATGLSSTHNEKKAEDATSASSEGIYTELIDDEQFSSAIGQEAVLDELSRYSPPIQDRHPLPFTYVDADDIPKRFSWGNVDGQSYLTKALNQHIPQ